MRDVSYKVIEEFDEKRDYSVKIQKRFISGLKIFKKGEEFFPKDIIDRFTENPPTKLKINRPNMAQFVYSMLNLAKKIGLMERNEKYDSRDFEEFSQKKTVIHWMSNLREPKTKHIEISNFKESSAMNVQKMMRFWNEATKCQQKEDYATAIGWFYEIHKLIPIEKRNQWIESEYKGIIELIEKFENSTPEKKAERRESYQKCLQMESDVFAMHIQFLMGQFEPAAENLKS